MLSPTSKSKLLKISPLSKLLSIDVNKTATVRRKMRQMMMMKMRMTRKKRRKGRKGKSNLAGSFVFHSHFV